LEERLLDPTAEPSAGNLRRQAAELRSAVAAQADALAQRLLETSFVRALSFSAMMSSPELFRLAMGELPWRLSFGNGIVLELRPTNVGLSYDQALSVLSGALQPVHLVARPSATTG
jgi:hypothetical protein